MLGDEELDLDLLLKLSPSINNAWINQAFCKVLSTLDKILELPRVHENYKILISSNFSDRNYNDFRKLHSLGVNQSVENSVIIIKISPDFNDFIPMILLREALFNYVPEDLKSSMVIALGINIIVESLLKKHQKIQEWKTMVRKALTDEELDITSEVEAVARLLKMKFPAGRMEHLKIFLKYIQDYSMTGEISLKDFYHEYFKNVVIGSSSQVFDDDVIEALRLLVKIFYLKKSLKSMSEFVHAFNSLRKDDKISTHLSTSAFKNAVKKINAHTSISASYQVNWNAINCQALAFLFVFNPEISTTKIERIIERFPFIVISKASYPHSITGFFVLPKVYLEELKDLLNKMEEHGYLIEKRLMNLESYSLFVNLNYLRDCFSKESLLDPKLNIYNDEYEIEFKMNFKGKKLVEQLGPLDFMILDKMRVNSIAGFGLEKYARLINDLKDEFRNEFLRMEKNILDFKQLIDLILKTKGMASIILKLIEKYKKKGFFGMSDWNKEIVKLMLKIPDCLYNEKGLNALDLMDDVPDSNEDRLISIGNIVTNSKLVKEMVSLYRKSKKDFQEALNARQVLIKLLNVMEELKIFDLSIIRKLIKEPKILESIYEKKLSKLRDEMRRMKSIKFSLKLIDEKIRRFVDSKPQVMKPLMVNTFMPIASFKNYMIAILKYSFQAVKKVRKLRRYFPATFYYSASDSFTGEHVIYLEITFPELGIKYKKELYKVIAKTFKDDLIRLGRAFYPGFMPFFTLKRFYDLSVKKFFFSRALFNEFFLHVKDVFGNELPRISEKPVDIAPIIASPRNTVESLVDKLTFNQSKDISKIHLDELAEVQEFCNNLKQYFKDFEKFTEKIRKKTIRKYVSSIRLVPNFPAFGLDQYFLILRPRNFKEIDFKFLLGNTFQEVRIAPSLRASPLFIIKQVFPLNNPERSYLNWLVLTKKAFSEVYLFKITGISQVIRLKQASNLSDCLPEFNSNIKPFKQFLAKTEDNFTLNSKATRTFLFDQAARDECLDPQAKPFINLKKIHDIKPTNLMELKLKNLPEKLKIARNFIKQKLATPIVSFRSEQMGFTQELTLILLGIPDSTLNDLISAIPGLTIATIMNLQGQLLNIKSNKFKTFERGFLVKLSFSNTIKEQLTSIIARILKTINVKRSIIIGETFDAMKIALPAFNLESLPSRYNPLENLTWDHQAKTWQNQKRFQESFETIDFKLI